MVSSAISFNAAHCDFLLSLYCDLPHIGLVHYHNALCITICLNLKHERASMCMVVVINKNVSIFKSCNLN